MSSGSGAPIRARKERSGRSYFSTSMAKEALSPAAARRDSARSSSFCSATLPHSRDDEDAQPQGRADDEREERGGDSVMHPCGVVDDHARRDHRDSERDQDHRQAIVAAGRPRPRELGDQALGRCWIAVYGPPHRLVDDRRADQPHDVDEAQCDGRDDRDHDDHFRCWHCLKLPWFWKLGRCAKAAWMTAYEKNLSS